MRDLTGERLGEQGPRRTRITSGDGETGSAVTMLREANGDVGGPATILLLSFVPDEFLLTCLCGGGIVLAVWATAGAVPAAAAGEATGE
jgi:hypothetical protein